MKIYILAWRNIWRNWKRTLITVSAIFLAVLLCTLMSSMQEGTYVKMIDNVVKFYSGYIQVYKPGYWKSRSIDDVYAPDKKLIDELKSNPKIEYFSPRLESFTLLSSGNNTKGAALIGIDPEGENKITNLARWVTEGKYLQPGDDGILVATNIAKSMKIKIGDTLTLLSQGYHGESAAGLFPVRGILKFPSPQLNNFGAYISLKAAQNFFSAPGMVTSNVIIVNDYKHVDKLNSSLQAKFPDYNFMTWKQIQPELLQMIEGDRAGGVVMKLVLYLVIGFGILGTVIMMMSERRREMGITIAIGMQKYTLIGTLFFETLYISLVGVIGGFLFSIPFISIMERNPILLTGKIAVAYEQFGIEPVLYFAMLPKVFIEQAVIVFIITFVIVFYPITKVSNMKIINAIRA